MSDDMDLDHPKSHDADSTSSATDTDDEPQVESLVAGRAKRATAGNRLSTLLDREADDELELLFAEDGIEEDVEFEGEDGEDASDVDLESSSDDEDQGPAAGADDLEGEKELEKQDRADRRKKRKAQALYKRPAPLKRKLVDPTATSTASVTPAPRPKKKSERLSWLPTVDEGPVRSSSRKQTVQNKEVVHLRMQETEKRRRQQIKVMEAAAKRKEASKPKAMTQADRMAEAARMEKMNSKSLNRWEETEKKRAEEQAARLEALHKRRIEGPFISWWSGPSKWADGNLVAVGSKKMIQEIKEPKGKARPVSTGGNPSKAKSTKTEEAVVSAVDSTHPSQPTPTSTSAVDPISQDDHSHPPILHEPPNDPPSSLLPSEQLPPEQLPPEQPPPEQLPHPPSEATPEMLPFHPKTPPPVPVIETSARNLVTLENFDGSVGRIPELQNHVLLRKKLKLQKQSTELCAITHTVAHYRDPQTGLAYANSYAYKEIQKVRNGGSRWSDLLQCYVGPVSVAARGVPEGFCRPKGH